MIRTAMQLCSLVIAGFAGVVFARVCGRAWWVSAPAAAAAWLVLSALTGIVRSRATTMRVRREGPDGQTSRALAAMAALQRVATGSAGFTHDSGSLAALEHAVLLGPGLGPRRSAVRLRLERSVCADLARSTVSARAVLVEGFVHIVDAAVHAGAAPLDALHPAASVLLRRLGVHDAQAPGTRLRAVVSGRGAAVDDPGCWAIRRAHFDPQNPEPAIAVRLLAAGYGHAALDALRLAPAGGPEDQLRRLARCCSLLSDAEEGGLLSLPPVTVARWHAELLLLAGRRLPELSPGSQLMTSVPGGAGTLERAVARTPIVVAQFVELAHTHPELQRCVATVIARIVGWPVGTVVTSMRDGTLTARPDAALRLHLRGIALLDEGRSSEAAAEFEAALLQAPDFAQAAFALAMTRRRAGRPGAGEDVLRALAEERRDDPEPLLFLARFLSSIGERERAREAFENGVRRFSAYVPLRVAFAQELVAWGCGDEAAEQLAATRREHPNEPRLALLAGRTLASEGRLGEAAQALEMASRGLSGPERAESWFWLMGVRRDQGDHTTAERIARRLIAALGTGQSGLLDDVADYLEERHDFLRAREAAERARRLRDGEPPR